MLCKQILYLKGNKKNHQNCTQIFTLEKIQVKHQIKLHRYEPRSLLFILFFFAYFYMCPCAACLCIDSCSYKENHLQSHRDGVGGRLAGDPRMSKDHPCGRDYTRHAEPSVKFVHVLKTRPKVFGTLVCFCLFAFIFVCVFVSLVFFVFCGFVSLFFFPPMFYEVL